MKEKLREKTDQRHKGSHPIYANDISKLLEIECNEQTAKFLLNVLSLLRFQAVTAVAFAFIFRIDEVFSLEYRDLKVYMDKGKRKMAIDLHEIKSIYSC